MPVASTNASSIRARPRSLCGPLKNVAVPRLVRLCVTISSSPSLRPSVTARIPSSIAGCECSDSIASWDRAIAVLEAFPESRELAMALSARSPTAVAS